MDPVANCIEAICNGHVEWQVLAFSTLFVAITFRIVSLVADVDQCLKK